MLRRPASRLTEMFEYMNMRSAKMISMMMMMPQLIVSDYCSDGEDGDDTDN